VAILDQEHKKRPGEVKQAQIQKDRKASRPGCGYDLEFRFRSNAQPGAACAKINESGFFQKPKQKVREIVRGAFWSVYFV
jgi:hypothetical protein